MSLSPRSTGAIADTSKLSRLLPSSKKCCGPVIHKMHFWLSTWGPLYLTWDKENDELGSETRQSGGSWSKGLSIPAHVFHFQQRAVPTIWFTNADGKRYEDAQTGRRYEARVQPLSMCHLPPSLTDCELLIQLSFKSITILDLVDKEIWKAGENGILWTFCKGVNRAKSRKVPDVFVLIVKRSKT